MKFKLDWNTPCRLERIGAANFRCNLDYISEEPGIYIFGRKSRKAIHALYVGQSQNIKMRIAQHFNNGRLMRHLEAQPRGTKYVYTADYIFDDLDGLQQALKYVELSVIRHYVRLGHDLMNTRGTKIKPRNEIVSEGEGPLPESLLIDR